MTSVIEADAPRVALVARGSARRRCWSITVIAVALVSTVYGIFTPGVEPSFLFAVSACGVLIGVDAVGWLTTRSGTYDPVGLVGVYGVFFFYLAPLLTVGWLQWPANLPAVHNLQGSFAQLSWLYALGLLAYRVAIDRWPVRLPGKARDFNAARFRLVMLVFAGLAAIAYAVVLVSFGGPAGYYSALGQGQANAMQALTGYGPLITAASWLPMALFAVLLVSKRDTLRHHSWLIVLAVVGFFLMTFVIDGMRGSRGAVVWPLLIAVGMVHYRVRSLSKLVVVFLTPAVLLFMFVYGIYKSTGVDGLARATAVDEATGVMTTSNRTLSTLVVGDLARTTTQVLTYERVIGDPAVRPAWGASYIGDLVSLLPGQVLSGIPTKVDAGSAALKDPGEEATHFSLIYGMSGEAMLNFGVAGAVLAFVVWIPLVRLAGRFAARATVQADAGAGLLAPGFALLAVYFLFNDLDNCAKFVLANMLPLMVGVAVARKG